LPADPPTVGAGGRWAILLVSFLAQAAATIVAQGAVFLIPALHSQRGLSLVEAGLVTAAPMLGVVMTIIGWGWVVDQYGERLVLLLGLGGTALFTGLAASAGSTRLLVLGLFLAGASAASCNVASGRVVVGWFPPDRRGLAMGIRQMAQPVGVGVAAVTLSVTAAHHGVAAALWVPAVAAVSALALVAFVIVDPPRGEAARIAAASPYTGDNFLWRVHGVSVLLVVPQFLVWAFALTWLIDDRGWSAGAAAGLVAAMQVLGAAGRSGAGHLSDKARSRMRPLRWVSVAATASMAVLGLTAGLGVTVSILLLVVAGVVTVADNGLAFTAVAERAGTWSGRALGVQSTAQFLAAAAVPPLAGLAIGRLGYAAVFALAALFPAVAIALVPVRGERADQVFGQLTGDARPVEVSASDAPI
jgi:MFS family permease